MVRLITLANHLQVSNTYPSKPKSGSQWRWIIKLWRCTLYSSYIKMPTINDNVFLIQYKCLIVTSPPPLSSRSQFIGVYSLKCAFDALAGPLFSLSKASQGIRNGQWDDPYSGNNERECSYTCAKSCLIPIISTKSRPNRPTQPSIRHYVRWRNYRRNYNICPALQIATKNEDKASCHHRGYSMNSGKPEWESTYRKRLVAVIDVNAPIQWRVL